MAQKQTPMMEQYLQLKREHSDELLLFRLGDFYELFLDDAKIASRELDLTLTGRGSNEDGRIPMCGVPFHAADSYIDKLVKKGYKVAICEQLEDPKLTKGLVKRDVIRVVTPGTVTSAQSMEANENNFLAFYWGQKKKGILLLCDLSTGDLLWEGSLTDQALCNALAMYHPAEILTVAGQYLPPLAANMASKQINSLVTAMPPFDEGEEAEAKGLLDDRFSDLSDGAVSQAIAHLLYYLQTVIKVDVSHIRRPKERRVEASMVLDASVLRHLEISRNLRDGGRKGSVLATIDKTVTAMGARLLKQWLENPLMDIQAIEARQHAIGNFLEHPEFLGELREALKGIFDFERIVGRLETGNVSTRDFASLRESFALLPSIKQLMAQGKSQLLVSLYEGIQCHDDLYELLCRALADQPAFTIAKGEVIRSGYNEELDELRSLSTNSQAWLQRLEDDIKAKTGIKLKTGYNKVFGYYFEVPNGSKDMVPEYFIRKQTLTNAERYITPELKEFEIKMLSAKERIEALETRLFNELKGAVKAQLMAIQDTAQALAQVDVLASLAVVAFEGQYVCPSFRKQGAIVIRDGRHPVIEQFLDKELFVPNDTELNHDTQEFMLITGPNMAGKSTYMRQVAVLLILGQMGSYIPAREASLSPVDRIFTRVGASDDISTGQSTFMVEMKELSQILAQATSRSLLILDEIGRGTSTFDGMSIAQAVVEYICERIGAKTLFATHYHELVGLEARYDKLKNYTVAVKERGDEVVFLRRIVRGGADKSYGIHVARLAGLPDQVLDRAKAILAAMEGDVDGATVALPLGESTPKAADGAFTSGNLFSQSVVDRLKTLDVMSMTPIEAMNCLFSLQEEARKS